MRGLVYTGTRAMEIRDVAEPAPADGQAVVEIALCGICGSDMHAWHGHDARRVPPLVLGHEAVGRVISAPGGTLAEGTRVAINPLMTCKSCPACDDGAVHLCPDRALIGLRVPGAFAERVAIDVGNLSVLPEELDFSGAVLAEPLAVCVHSVRLGLAQPALAGRDPGDTATAVIGGGAIGLLTALVLKARGFTRIAVAETAEPRRRLVDAVLPGAAFDPREEGAGPAPGSVPLVIDAVGSGRTRALASTLAAPGGTIVHVGLQDSAEGLDTRRLTLQEISFLGTYCYDREDFAAALALLADGTIRPGVWAETRPLDAGAASFEEIDRGEAPAKIVLSL